MANNNIFNDKQLDMIRQALYKELSNHIKSSIYSEILEIINICQRELGYAEISDLMKFQNDKFNKEMEKAAGEQIEESDFYAAKAVADWMNANPDWNWSSLIQIANEHNLRRFDYSDDTYFRNDQYVVCRVWAGKYIFESIDNYDLD